MPDLTRLLTVDPDRCPLSVVCCSHHFRACLSAVVGSADSERIVTVDGGGLGSTVAAMNACMHECNCDLNGASALP